MTFTIIISVISVLLMILLIFKKSSIEIKGHSIDIFYIPVLLGAILLLIFPVFDKTELKNLIFSNSTMNPLKILVLFISISFLSIVLDEAGFFSYIATIFINKYKSSQIKLFISIYIMVSILTVFTSNDIVILTFTPFILYFAKRGNINPIPYLVMEFVAANTYSMLLPIGNPTNIYLTSVYNLNFLTYISKMIIPAILSGLISITVIYLIFRKDLKKKIEVFDLSEAMLNKPLCIISLIHLLSTIVLLVISNYIKIEAWTISLSFALSLLVILLIYSIVNKNLKNVSKSIKRIPYSLIPFILSMFVIIMALNSFGIFANIHQLIEKLPNENLKEIAYLVSSTLSSNILNNIPMTIAYGEILGDVANNNLIYATIIGSNIGAILSPIGALAGIMWMHILKDNNVDYGFMKFFKNGMILVSMLLIFLSLYFLCI